MSLQKSRSVISWLASFLLALCIAGAALATVVDLTVANAGFIEKAIVNSNVVSECENQLDLQLGALSKRSGIPERVFENVKKEVSVKEALVSSFDGIYNHTENNSKNEQRVQYFYNLCIEYLEGNNISYSSENVMNTAVLAAEIYKNCCEFHNLEYLVDVADSIRAEVPVAVSVFIVLELILGSVFFFLYSNKYRSCSYVYSSVSAAGVCLIIIGVAGALFASRVGIVFEPEVYFFTFKNLIKTMFMWLCLSGIVLASGGFAGNVFVYKQKLKKRRNG